MDVDPVVAENVGLVDDDSDSEKITVAQLACRFDHRSGRWRIECCNQILDGHRGDELVGVYARFMSSPIAETYPSDPITFQMEFCHPIAEPHREIFLLEILRDLLPQHARSQTRVEKARDQGRNLVVLGPEEHVLYELVEVEVFYALS